MVNALSAFERTTLLSIHQQSWRTANFMFASHKPALCVHHRRATFRFSLINHTRPKCFSAFSASPFKVQKRFGNAADAAGALKVQDRLGYYAALPHTLAVGPSLYLPWLHTPQERRTKSMPTLALTSRPPAHSNVARNSVQKNGLTAGRNTQFVKLHAWKHTDVCGPPVQPHACCSINRRVSIGQQSGTLCLSLLVMPPSHTWLPCYLLAKA